MSAGGAEGGASFAEMGAHLHPDVVLRQGPSVPYPGDWVGVAGVERFFGVFSRTWQSLNLSEARYFVSADGVAISHRMRAVARATGRRVDVPIGQLILFDDGLIRDFTVFYLDPVTVTDATRP
ncbi:nuclear transport factor 2 family protein [Streptomyces sp. NPDC051976]|uniref:nuclear transport factor 2 family protein n=1 Tax=Streptomyces sp. NPDC051976 TaxID=3154947 RepID=UPI00341D9746